MTYKSSHGDGKTFTAREIEQIGDAQCVMGMRNSLAAHAMVALIAGEVDAPAVAELEQAERTANSSAETCAGAAECAADRADRAAESAESAGATDADGAWAAAEEAERAARDAQVCAQQIPADRVAYADRARSAVSRAQDAAERARRTAEDRQCAADDERCGIAAAEEAESAANAARESATAAGRWADGCPPVGDAPAVLNVWVQEARAAAAEAAQWAERARSAAASREAELRPWGRIEWHTIAGAAADDARDAAKRAAESARLAAGARGRADRAAAAEEPALDSPAPSQERDADAPNGVGAEGGKEGISPELDADASIKPGGAAPAADGDEGEGGGGALVAGPHPGRGPVSGPAAGAPAEPAAHRTAEGPVAAAPEVPALPRGFDADAPTGPAPEITRARRRAEEAELRAVEARRRAEQLHTSADAHYGRFAGGQPILMGHHSARGALRARERGDAATRRAVEATAAAERAERDARKATAEAERAAIVHGRSRPWERSDFRPGDVVEARKVYTDRYVVVRANPKTVTLRNVNTITDTKARYDQILSRTRDGQTVTNPGADDSPAPADVPAAPPAGPATDAPAEPAADVPEWAPAPGAERWDFAAVRRVLVREGLVEGELGERDGWQIGPDMWDVRIMRVQGSDCFRPRGAAARGSWDEALDAYRAAVEAAGMTVVRRNAHCVVVRVADELRVTARARRTAELEDFTTTVTFDGYEGIGGTVTLHSAGAGASWFEVRDHTGRTIPDPGRDRRTATASLAHAYGLPTPAEYIEEGPAPAAPARAEGPPAPAVPAESGPAPQRAEGELRDLVHDADRPAVPEPSAAAVPPPAEPGPEADGGPAPAAGPRPGPPPGGAPAAAGAPRRAAGAPRGRVPVARGSAAGVRGYPHRSQQPTGGHATTPTTTPTTTPGAGTGGRAAGGRGPPRLPGPGPGPGGCAPVELDRNASRATGGAPPGRTPPPSAHALSVPYAKVPT
ncbi:DUF3560 domain-containing protein [Streptomyces tsukubensis]|uniref:DUF3560 domain-containing protein n=1 Tax=Streptomyces tsukubensis TaxID=83656 RepID=UPI00344FA626